MLVSKFRRIFVLPNHVVTACRKTFSLCCKGSQRKCLPIEAAMMGVLLRALQELPPSLRVTAGVRFRGRRKMQNRSRIGVE